MDPESLHIFYTNKEVADHNEKLLATIETPLITIKAGRYAGPKNYSPPISADGRIANTQFFDLLKIKVGARCALSWNISTQDGLVNGACGTIVGIERKKLSKDNVHAIIVRFDGEKTGQNQRQKYPQISKKFEHLHGTPILMYEHEYNIISRKGFKQAITGKIKQFPLRIYYASTAHKMQGQTIKAGNKVVIHWHKDMAREKGMAYVMLGRAQKMDDIYLCGTLNFDGISCSNTALLESNRLLTAFDTNEINAMQLSASHWKICYLNVRSVKSDAQKKKVLVEHLLTSSDIFSLGETWLDTEDTFEIEGFASIYANAGKGKGVTVYSKVPLNSEPLVLKLEDLFAIKVNTFAFDVISFYVSSSCDQHKICDVLLELIDDSNPTVVMGDMNFDARDFKKVTKFLHEKSFHQIIQRATHERGRLIDHMYVNNKLKDSGIKHSQTGTFVSDHDILELYVPKLKE